MNYNDGKWSNAKTVSPKLDKINAQEMPPIRRLQELAPKKVFKSRATGNWIVDFGQNIAGWVQITVNEKEGQVIEITPTEALTQNGDNIYPGSTGGGANGMPQLLKYICKGGGIETWEPKFSYHGFRYVEITGISEKPSSQSIKAVLVANDVAEQGSFVCSDPLLNKMDTISKWTIIDNGMGDWCPPRWDRRKNPVEMECHPVVSANAYFYDILGIMEYFAKMNQDKVFETKMRQEKAQLLDAFNKEYLTKIPLTTYEWYGSQTATVMALQFGMVAEDKIKSVVKGLTYNIEAVKGGHHATGIHGNRYIYTVLNKYGEADLAQQILTTPTFPSQTYVMNYGFTTWPERQFYWEEMEGLTNSLNHPMHSGFAAYFYESLGGIKATPEAPGYKEFTVNPIFQKAITHTAVEVPSPYGLIKNNWEITDGNFSMNLTIPFNTKAKVVLTPTKLKSLKINGATWAQFQKTHKAAIMEDSVLSLGSGAYRIEYLMNEI